MTSDLHRRALHDAELAATDLPATRGAPGKSTVSSRLPPPPAPVIFRLDAGDRGAARDANGVDAGADDAIATAAGSSGAPLPDDLRARFEGSLGADLSSVRVHTGAASAEAAAAVGAHAYTVGRDIHFGAGKYDPCSAFGVHLLAHEVAHTVQQQGGAPTRQHKLEVSTPGDAAEVEADRAADAMVAGSAFAIARPAPTAVHREVGETEVELVQGKNEYAAKVKDNKLAGTGYARKLFDRDLGSKQICPEPPLFLTASAAAKVAGEGEGEDGATAVKGKVTVEVTGSIVMGAVAQGLKAGIEGSIKGSASAEAGVKVLSGGADLQVSPFDAEVVVDAYLGLVAETGEDTAKVGGSIKRHLSSLELGTLSWDGSTPQWTWTITSEALAQAGKDLLVESAKLAGEVFVPGYGAYQQYKRDEEALETFHANTARMDAESDKERSEKDAAERRDERFERMREQGALTGKKTAMQDTGQNTSAAEQRKLIDGRHAQVKAKVDAARAKANAAKSKCNSLASQGKEVKPAAQALYSEGFKLYSMGEKSWATVEAAAAAGDNEKHFNYSWAAQNEFEQSAEKFGAGDVAQG